MANIVSKSHIVYFKNHKVLGPTHIVQSCTDSIRIYKMFERFFASDNMDLSKECVNLIRIYAQNTHVDLY